MGLPVLQAGNRPTKGGAVVSPAMFRALRTRLAIFRLCRKAIQLARDRGVRASAFFIGVYWLHPRHLVVFVKVKGDAEKRLLLDDTSFMESLRRALVQVRYPPEGREGIRFDVESQERVNREFEGSWYYRLK